MRMEDSAEVEGVAWGDVALPLTVVEVRPCCPCSWHQQHPTAESPRFERRRCDNQKYEDPALTAAFLKTQLMRSTLRSLLVIGENHKNCIHLQPDQPPDPVTRRYEDAERLIGGDLILSTKTTTQFPSDKNHQREEGLVENILYFPSNDPTCTTLWPCRCRGYARADYFANCRNTVHTATPIVLVTETTLVRVHAVQCDASSPLCSDKDWKHLLTGEVVQPFDPAEMEESIIVAQNPSAVREFSLRMKGCLTGLIQVGTTVDSLERNRQRHLSLVKRTSTLNAALATYMDRKSTLANAQATIARKSDTFTSMTPAMFRDGALLLHSPDHGAGKTCLTEMIAHRLDARMHIIRSGPLLAKYGVHADTALQCIVHAAAIDAALLGQPLCILLDDFDAFLSTGNSLAAGDAANPVVHGIAAYLHTLTTSVRERQELPFPTNNLLYNLNGRRGEVLSLHLCIVMALTCPDNDKRLSMHTLNAMGTYRLPSLTSTTRLAAFRWALSKERVELTPDGANRLPFLAASAVWARGDLFRRIARMVRTRTKASESNNSANNTRIASINDLQRAISEFAPASSKICDVQFFADSTTDSDSLFGSIGGCQEAKSVLEDSISLDPDRRKLLLSFGLSPPTGVLLYGPPGTGKTLLAKAVAKLLRSNSSGFASSFVGGAFISLSSTDIVRATVGSGERMVVSAFQTARLNSPAVIFIDEFQALFTERCGGGSSRLTTTLIQCMDDVKLWSDVKRSAESATASDGEDRSREGQVLVLAATNTPWMIDQAFLRPGRFDRAVHVDLPSVEERISILRIHIGRMKTCFANDETTLSNVCGRIAHVTEGYSGAGLAALCRSAAIQALADRSDCVEDEHFMRVLNEGIVSQTSSSLVLRNKRWRP